MKTTISPSLHDGVLQGTFGDVSRDVIERTAAIGGLYKKVLGASVALTGVGVLGFLLIAFTGSDDRSQWGYLAAMVGYLLTTALAAPMVSIACRSVRANWGKPLARVAELYAITGLGVLLAYVPLVVALPSLYPNSDLPKESLRHTIWVYWHPHAPHIYDSLALLTLVITGIALVLISSIPDMAEFGARATGKRASIAARLSKSWRGTQKQWTARRAAIGLLSGLYFMGFLTLHYQYSSDFAMSLVPGWKDSIFPVWHALSGLQCACATVMVTMYALRRWGGYTAYFGVNQFWSLGKIMLALSLLWFYFWFMGFFTFWYGRIPAEMAVLEFLFTEQYRILFLVAFILNFLAPLLILVWNKVRRSTGGPALAALLILIGALVDRIRIYVGSWSIEDSFGHSLKEMPPAQLPTIPDAMVIVGGIGLVLMIYMIVAKVIPIISMWETKEQLLYVSHRTLLKKKYMLIGKPD